jgi:phosphoesterase RecJ-like protein
MSQDSPKPDRGHVKRRPNPEPGEDFLEFVRGGRKTLILGHHHPDGDAVGSAVALAHGLRSLGLEVSVGLSGQVSRSLDYLMRPTEMFLDLTAEDSGVPGPFGDFDRLVLVDCQTPHRVWPEIKTTSFEGFTPFAAVDHHHQDAEPSHWRFAFLDRHASATGELIFKILKKLGVPFSPPIVESLLSALVSDTGSFSQGNATAECLSQASELVRLGGDIERINQNLKRDWTLSKFRLFAEAMTSVRLDCGGRAAGMVLDERILADTGADLTEAEGLVERPLFMAGVDLSVLAKIDGRGRTRVSLRSRPGVDARELARRFGGGGHKQAAAYSDDSPDPTEALERLMTQARLVLTKAGG